MGKFCSNCGKALNDSVKFCPYCGFAVSEEKSVNIASSDNHNKYCSKCGYKLDNDDLFCPECGAKCNNINEIQNNNDFNQTPHENINKKDSFNFIKVFIIGFLSAIFSLIIGYFLALLLNHFEGFSFGIVITATIIAISRHTNEVELAFEGACMGLITALILLFLFSDGVVTLIVMIYRILLYTFVGGFVAGAEMFFNDKDND